MVYVLSDIHGNMRRFKSILKQINLQPEDTLYILGDVIDRHPDGIKILRQIMAMPNAKMLLGNHEYMMLRALKEPYDGEDDWEDEQPDAAISLWYQNGGGVTHNSWKHTRIAVRAEIIAYLHSLPLNYTVEVGGKRFLLVHGAAEEKSRFYGTKHKGIVTHFAVWDRRASTELSVPDGYTLIFGHTPTINLQDQIVLEIWYGEHRIGIDCGSGFPDGNTRWDCYGRLACLRLDDMKEFYSEECTDSEKG